MAALVLGLLAACGGGGDEGDDVGVGGGTGGGFGDGPGASAAVPGPSPRAGAGAVTVDLCALLTDDEVADAIGVAVTSVEPAPLSCRKGDGGTRVVVVRLLPPGAGPDSSFENLRLGGAEPVPEIDVENLYDAAYEELRMRTPDGHHLMVQLDISGMGDRDALVALARAALDRFLAS